MKGWCLGIGLFFVFRGGIIIFVVESVVTGSAIGQSLLGSGKGVGQSGPFTVGIGPVTVVADLHGDHRAFAQWASGGFEYSGWSVAYGEGFGVRFRDSGNEGGGV